MPEQAPPPTRAPVNAPASAPSSEFTENPRAQRIQASALQALAPLVRMLVEEGISYPMLIRGLKQVYAQESESLLKARGQKITDSAISVLSGVHRKDLRDWRQHQSSPRQVSSLASQVFARWVGDPDYLDPKGQPLMLPKSGPKPSFESLVQATTLDVYPVAILSSMLSMGMVQENGQGRLTLDASGYVPGEQLDDLLGFFTANLADHLAAASNNIRHPESSFLEQSVYADELSPASIESLSQLAQTLWLKVQQDFTRAALQANEQDAEKPPKARQQRLRMGVYFFSEDMKPADSAESDGQP